MQRLHLNQGAGSQRNFPARPLGSQGMACVNPAVAAARNLREQTSSVSVPVSSVAETGLARAFVISQGSIYPKYDPAEGWKRGTLFVSLDKPLKGVHGCE